MSSSKAKKKKEEEEKKKEKYAILTADHLLTKDKDFIEATANYNPNYFGRRTSKKKKTHSLKQTRKRRTSRPRRPRRPRKFGSIENNHLKQFLIIALFMIIRSIAKGEPYKQHVENDLNMITNNAFNVLTISSILELITKLVGPENRDKILLAYTLFSIGNDITRVI
jgi:hypothetical protein